MSDLISTLLLNVIVTRTLIVFVQFVPGTTLLQPQSSIFEKNHPTSVNNTAISHALIVKYVKCILSHYNYVNPHFDPPWALSLSSRLLVLLIVRFILVYKYRISRGHFQLAVSLFLLIMRSRGRNIILYIFVQ